MLKRSVMLILLIIFLIPLKGTAADSTFSGGQKLLLFYSNDVLGETEPCG